MGKAGATSNRSRELVAALVRLTADPTRRAPVRELTAAVDPGDFLALLGRLRVTTPLGRLLLDDGDLSLPDELTNALRNRRAFARRHGLLQHGLTVRLVQALERAGILTAPLKGAALADTVYGDLGARMSSDIDVLVRPADLDEAVAVAESQGWREPDHLRENELPRLHRELVHDTHPPLEIHWRVHWYEDEFSTAALERAEPAGDGLRRFQPADEIACLLLFLARDGFAGLRQTVDVAAWWAALGDTPATAAGVRQIAHRHPALASALSAAAHHAETFAAIPRGALGSVDLSRRQRAAVRRANPWLRGSSEQVDATNSLIDGLLSPPGGGGQFARRQLFPPAAAVIRRQPELREASSLRVGAARAAHASRLLARYAIAAAGPMLRRRAGARSCPDPRTPGGT